MGLGYLVVAAVAVLVTVFALQNTDPTTVRLLLWKLEGVPLAVLLLATLGAGLLIAGVPLAIKLTVWRSRARSQEARVNMLETAVADRDRRLLNMPRKTP